MQSPTGSPAAYRPTRIATAPAPKCPTCNTSVYAAEAAKGPASTTYHKMCLKCAACARKLEPLNMLEHDALPYCQGCHVQQFGPKGYGMGRATSTDYQSRLGSPSPSASPQRLSSYRSFLPPPTLASDDEPPSLSSGSSPVGRSRPLPQTPSLPKVAAASAPHAQSEDRCARCGKMAYFAERVRAANHTWHKLCLKCTKCSRTLDSSLSVSGDLPYCNKCHAELSGVASMKLS